MRRRRSIEGLKLARLLMVFSSISPLFVIWAIKGTELFPDNYFMAACLGMVVIPNLFLLWRVRTARRDRDVRQLVVGSAEDHREHLLVYLFAMLLPFYQTDMNSWRDLGATLLALSFIIFLFWHLNLHYMNIIFAARGYRVFTISPPTSDYPFSQSRAFVLITRRQSLLPGERIVAYRVSDTVYFEGEEPQ